MDDCANDCQFVVVKLLQSPNYKKRQRENRLPEVPVYSNAEIISAVAPQLNIPANYDLEEKRNTKIIDAAFGR